jgi:hypothetical protein
MTLQSIAVLAAESGAHEEGGVSPWIVGPVAFGILVVLLLAVISFGGGRDHS